MKRNRNENSFSCKVPAGKEIKPWLIWGPFYKSFADRVKGLTFFEGGVSAGKDVMKEVVGEAEQIICSSPYREGQETSFLGMTGRWNLARKPEKYLAWGRYNFSNHLATVFLTTVIVPEHSGCKQWRLRTNTRAIVSINSNMTFDTDNDRSILLKDGLAEYDFTTELHAGENTLTIALFRLGRGAAVGFFIECVDGDMEVRVPLTKAVSSAIRMEIEEEIKELYLERDVFYPEHEIGFLLNKAPTSKARLKVQLSSLEGNILSESIPSGKGRVVVCSGAELADGEYRLVCLWESREGQPITSVTFDIAKITPTRPLVGYEHLEERRRILLEHFADHPNYVNEELWTPVAGYILGRYEKIWAQVARYAMDRYEEIDYEIIVDTCKYILDRKDCSEFLIQAILRLMYWERKNPRLNAEVRALMKDTILEFKYWIDEPGDTIMHMSSENHRLLFHTAEWLAGQLFPLEKFRNSCQRGLYHVLKGRMFLAEWLRQRGRFGFDEWNSNCYYSVNIAPLINIYDFVPPEDQKLRHMTKQILDYMFYILAENTFHGVFGTTHGRSYGTYIKYPDYEYTAPVCWLLYGEGSLWGGGSMGAVSLATSTYELPKMFAEIAADDSTIVESYQRQGLFMGNELSANFVVYRTPDYMLSGLQDFQKGERGFQEHVAQITLKNKAVVFWSCPHTTSEGPGIRPDYWSGNIIIPRVIQYRNVLALVWRQDELSWMTHCFFEQDKFDEVKFEGKWVFARVEDGYAGIYSHHGLSVGKFGQFAGRELVCYAPDNIWLVECGRKTDWGSFDHFVQALKSARIKEEKEKLIYISPSIGEFVVGWDIEPTVNGNPVKLRDYPLIKSVWANSEFGSGHITLQYNEEKMEFWFD